MHAYMININAIKILSHAENCEFYDDNDDGGRFCM